MAAGAAAFTPACRGLLCFSPPRKCPDNSHSLAFARLEALVPTSEAQQSSSMYRNRGNGMIAIPHTRGSGIALLPRYWEVEPCAPRVRDVRGRVAGGDGEGNPNPNPLGDPSYWDQAEGKEKLNAIEDLRELVAEGERIQSQSQSQAPGGDAGVGEEEAKRELREELARAAKQQAEQRKEAEVMFEMAQRAYGRGVYDKSVQLLEAALTNVSERSNLGGEVQIWLAMAYEADNRHADCIALYKRLEQTHPNRATRRQAADLRYILEAPKLKINKDEMVSIPLIGSEPDKDTKTWSQMVKERRRSKAKSKTPASHDYLEDWLVWNPPRWERNPYFWVAFSIWLTLVAIALLYQH